jgi:hypothetical protein
VRGFKYVKWYRSATVPRAVHPEHLRLLTPGATYETVVANLSRLLRAGLPMREAADVVLEHAGLSRFPRPLSFDATPDGGLIPAQQPPLVH